MQGSINKGALVGGIGRYRNARGEGTVELGPLEGTHTLSYSLILSPGAAPVTRVLKPRSVIPAGRAGVWGGGGDLQVTLVDPTLVVEVLDDTAREYGRWRPEDVSGIVIPGHREVM